VTRRSELRGVAASIGVAVGPARLLGRGRRRASYRQIADDDVSSELARFDEAVAESRSEIEAAKEQLTVQHGSSYAPILDVHLLMHGDALLVGAIADTIRNERINAEWALSRVTERLKKPLLENASPYFQERAEDIEHVRQHLLRHLRGERRGDAPTGEPVILLANDLTPADAVHMLAPPTIGLVTEMGAPSSHTAILARTFGVPAVVSVGSLPPEARDDEMVVVDGFSGHVVVGASLDERREAEGRRQRFIAFLESERSSQAVTRDGVSIAITANVELPTEIETALENGAEGIGLYRTEFMCLDREEPPPEDEQVALYRRVVTAMAPRRVVFRTFDWRGDKRLRSNVTGRETHDWLEAQIKAVLRASHEGSAALMFPMVATVEDLQIARARVDRCRRELGGEIGAELPVGIMVEVPSAALLASRLAQHADFFAVGTNDLAHYTLAYERRDPRSAANPLDPSVLVLIEQAATAAREADIPYSMCGDMAADPVALGLALGLGYRQISVPVSVLPLARAVVRNLDLGVATEVARDALQCESAGEVRALLLERLEPQLGALWRGQGIA
jgi:phosphoenolpyruvate-protein phosphotransferase